MRLPKGLSRQNAREPLVVRRWSQRRGRGNCRTGPIGFQAGPGRNPERRFGFVLGRTAGRREPRSL